jgi:murein DD-endopeptidase MepM/ murein hydrolase activator NlpD/SH3-like domain-containing protein
MPAISPLNKCIIFSCLVTFAFSCTAPGPGGLFGKRSPHDNYAEKLKSAGLDQTELGRQWFGAANQSLLSPLTVNLPYSETGYFPANEAKAVGLIFTARRGEKLSIDISKKPAGAFAIYLDLWQPAATPGAKPTFLLSADTTLATLSYDVEKEGSYILRLQPELLRGGEYKLSISTGPTLAFPVTPKAKSNIGSFWGVDRDGGARHHEGIDIFAPRNTAAVAAANGVVTRVTENTLGGKVVFLSPAGKDYSLYYAHLDKQLVEPGQTLQTGDTVGLVGNTGNARTTSPHLHFGIYTTGGAIDPLPFVNRVVKTPVKISAPLHNLDKFVRNNATIRLLSAPSANAGYALEVAPNTLIKVEAATVGWYKVTLPEGEQGFIPANNVASISSPIRKLTLKNNLALLDKPDSAAARKATLTATQIVNIMAAYKDYYYISNEKENGWISKKLL